MAKKAPSADDRLNDAHFRLDESERRLDTLEKTIAPEMLAELVKRAAQIMFDGMKMEQAKLLTAVREDTETDRAVVQAIRELIEELRRPKERRSTVQLPSGEVSVTTHES